MLEQAYATVKDCLDIVPSLAEPHEDSARLEAMLVQSLLDSSRLLETDLQLPVNYFSGQSVYSIRQFFGNGTQYVRLFPYSDLSEIRDSDGELIDTEEYRLTNGLIPSPENSPMIYQPSSYTLQWVYSRRFCGRPSWLLPISVTAKWGFACIPPDVTLAVKSMACLLFLNNPLTESGLSTSLSDNQEQRLRQNYNRVMSAWSDKLHHTRNLGVV